MKLSITLLGVVLLGAQVGWADSQNVPPVDEEIVDSKEQKSKDLEDPFRVCDQLGRDDVNEDWEAVVKDLLPSLSNKAMVEIVASIRQSIMAGVELCTKLRDALEGVVDEPQASTMNEEIVKNKEQRRKDLENSIQQCDKMVEIRDDDVNVDWEPVVKELLPSLSNDAVVRVAASFRQVEAASHELCRKLRRE